ncbi:FAD-binding protein [Ensifer soli]|uniref:FAD-binding protein n=1 Tax=Ciceribacter sp. sgz301302 TaxID=3342379 RepID=UPI0035B93D74
MSADLLPETEAEAAAVIREAASGRTTLAILGGGTRRGLGHPVAVSRSLSTARLSGITTYTPAEMTMSARAGTPLAAIQAALDDNRQMLAFEPIDHRGLYGTGGEPTIGGAIAVNASGPRRYTGGAARDHLLGVRFVNGAGETIKAGGRVMKNVTGLDLAKFLCGSHGTLSLLTEVTFKVLPVPPASATVVVSGLDDAQAAAGMARAMALPCDVSGAAHLPELVSGKVHGGALPSGPATLLRIEGLPASVEMRARKLAAAFAGAGPVATLDREATAGLWREIRDVAPYAEDGSGRPLWRVSVAPGAGHLVVAALRLHAGVDAFYDWQGGLVWLRMEADPEAGLLRRLIRELGGGHATLVRAGDAVKATVPVFEPLAAPVAALSVRLKQKFDPQCIFNPGRMG